MSGWNSRIQIRTDADSAWNPPDPDNPEGDLPPGRTLDEGELGAGINSKGTGVQLRVGIANNQPFMDSPLLAAGEPGELPVVVAKDSTGSGSGTLWWDGGQWQPDGATIEWSASASSGAVTYDSVTDTWSTDPSLVVITDADGGTFSGSFVAPTFSAGYQPQIGEP
jgi:hypothetical protein